MDNFTFTPTETQSSSNNKFFNSIESLCLNNVPRKGILKTISTANLVSEIEYPNESILSPPPPNQYGYLEHIQTYKSSCKFYDKSLPKKVRKFYAKQLTLIKSLEDILVPKTLEETQTRLANQQREKRIIQLTILTHLIINIIIIIIKIIGAILSRSLSVSSSVANSILDIRTNLTLMWTSHSIKKHDPYKYPAGRTRLRTVTIITLSVVMCTTSIQLIIESSEQLSQDVQYFQNQHNASSTKTLPNIDMSTFPIVAMVFSIVSKGVLYILSYRSYHPSVSILNEDNKYDVISAIVALTCGLITSNAKEGRINTKAVVIDPVGAIVISLFILIAWAVNAYRHIRLLRGLSGDCLDLQLITHIVYNHRPDVVEKIDSVRAVHFGLNYFVDIDIGLTPTMPLAIGHDIGMELQNQLETLDVIERAYIHLDYEHTHMPAYEHKML